jgi:hypothetical protein
MHGLTHVVGGPDPVPGLLPPLGDTLDEKILALLPDGFWKLNESSGSVAADSSGFGQDLSTTSPELDPVWGFPAGPPGQQAADLTAGTGGSAGVATAARVSRPWPQIVSSFTAGIWVNRTSDTDGSQIMGQGGPVRAGGDGWEIDVVGASHSPANRIRAVMKGAAAVYALNELPPDVWAFVAVAYDAAAATFKLYVDGLLQDESASFTFDPVDGTSPLWVGHDGGYHITSIVPCAFAGSYAFLVNRAMSGAELLAINDSDPVPDTEGLVLTLDEDGNPVWGPPPVPDVTVNGSPPTHASTPQPAPPPVPTDPDDAFPGVTDWIGDQPFVYGGSTFTVQPHTWTTIPFTTPLMERWSNAGGTTHYEELDDDDPDSAGWVDDATEYTAKAIVIPHDMPFLPSSEFDWMQICLKIESPAVDEIESSRALRVFETTRQKTLIQEYRPRWLAGGDSGALHVFRELGKPGTDTDSVFAARGPDLGASAVPDDIMFMPVSGGGFSMNGYDWLPRVDGVPTLKEGMRLVAQVWHDAPTPLEFDCSNPYPYRPHLAILQKCDRAWGAPWSSWPT